MTPRKSNISGGRSCQVGLFFSFTPLCFRSPYMVNTSDQCGNRMKSPPQFLDHMCELDQIQHHGRLGPGLGPLGSKCILVPALANQARPSHNFELLGIKVQCHQHRCLGNLDFSQVARMQKILIPMAEETRDSENLCLAPLSPLTALRVRRWTRPDWYQVEVSFSSCSRCQK